jgi:hypothetical protein
MRIQDNMSHYINMINTVERSQYTNTIETKQHGILYEMYRIDPPKTIICRICLKWITGMHHRLSQHLQVNNILVQ